MNLTPIIQIAVTFLGTLAGAGPWGLGAMVLGIGAAIFGVNKAISKFNKNADIKDQENAGADAGITATELQRQTREVASNLETIGNNNPATPPPKD